MCCVGLWSVLPIILCTKQKSILGGWNLERRLIDNRIQRLDSPSSGLGKFREGGNKQVLVKWLADCQMICTGYRNRSREWQLCGDVCRITVPYQRVPFNVSAAITISFNPLFSPPSSLHSTTFTHGGGGGGSKSSLIIILDTRTVLKLAPSTPKFQEPFNADLPKCNCKEWHHLWNFNTMLLQNGEFLIYRKAVKERLLP